MEISNRRLQNKRFGVQGQRAVLFFRFCRFRGTEDGAQYACRSLDFLRH